MPQEFSLELIPSIFNQNNSTEKLYFKYSPQRPKNQNKNLIIFDQDKFYHYKSIYGETGPYNLNYIREFCLQLHKLLFKHRSSNNAIIHYVSTTVSELKKTNSVFLICCYMVLFHRSDSKEIYDKFKGIGLLLYEDFSQSQILDLINSLVFAMNKKWFDIETFNVQNYENMQLYASGDMNWIIPGEVLAMGTPSDENIALNSGQKIAGILKNLGMRTVIRLNKPLYNPNSFIAQGIAHYDFYYDDGTVPPKDVFIKCLKVLRACNRPYVVHCKAGLGRTGTMIGAYLITKYGMPAKLAIGWMRLCRSGMVNGTQQDFLLDLQIGNLGPSPYNENSLPLDNNSKPKSSFVFSFISTNVGSWEKEEKRKISFETPIMLNTNRSRSEKRYPRDRSGGSAVKRDDSMVTRSPENFFTDRGRRGDCQSKNKSIRKSGYNPLSFTMKKKRDMNHLAEQLNQLRRTPRKNCHLRLPRTASSASKNSKLDLKKLDRVMKNSGKKRKKNRKKMKKNPLKKNIQLERKRKKIENLIMNHLSRPKNLNASVNLKKKLKFNENPKKTKSFIVPYGLKSSFHTMQPSSFRAYNTEESTSRRRKFDPSLQNQQQFNSFVLTAQQEPPHSQNRTMNQDYHFPLNTEQNFYMNLKNDNKQKFERRVNFRGNNNNLKKETSTKKISLDNKFFSRNGRLKFFNNSNRNTSRKRDRSYCNRKNLSNEGRGRDFLSFDKKMNFF